MDIYKKKKELYTTKGILPPCTYLVADLLSGLGRGRVRARQLSRRRGSAHVRSFILKLINRPDFSQNRLFVKGIAPMAMLAFPLLPQWPEPLCITWEHSLLL